VVILDPRNLHETMGRGCPLVTHWTTPGE